MSKLVREYYLESDPDGRKREVLTKYRHINVKLECLYRDSLLGVSLESGVLSELVVKDYLEDTLGKENVFLANKKQKGFDLIVKCDDGSEKRIQVKSKELNSWVNTKNSRSYHYHKLTEKNSDFDILYTVFVSPTFVWICNPIENPRKNNLESMIFRLNTLYGNDFIDYIINRAKFEWNKFGTDIVDYKINT